MASKKIKGITIQYEGDTTKLETALSSVEKKGRNARAEMSEVNKALKEAPDSVLLWQQKQKLLNDALDSSKDKLKLLEDAQEQVTEQFKKGDIGEEQYRAFERELEKARAETEKLGNEAEDAGKHVEELGSEAGKTSGDLDKMGSSAEQSSEGFTVLKGAVANLAAEGFEKLISSLKEAAKQALEYEDAIAKVSTIADDAIPVDKISNDIIELSNESGIAANIIADATYDAISAGQKTADAVAFVGDVTKLARAGFAETGATLDLLTTVLNAYHLEASEAARVSDVLIQTQNLGKTSVGQLSSAMGKIIPTANAYNVELEQLAAGYALMTSNGVATSETTTYMNSMLNELGKNGTKASNILKNETGKSFKDLMEEGKTLSDVLSIIKDNADKSNLSFGDMWGSAEAGKAGLIILGDSAEVFNEALDKMQNSAGATDKAFEKLETKEYALEKAQNQLKNTVISIGSAALEMLVPMAEKTLPIIEKKLTSFNANLPKIEKTVSNMIPLIKNVATAYASWKIASTAKSGIDALKVFTTQMKTTELAATSLGKALDTSVLAIISMIAMSLVDLGRDIKKAYDEYVPTAERIGKEVADSFKEQDEAIENVQKSLDDLDESFKDSAQAADIETEKAKDLWSELDKLADANGRVKDSDKKRAEYILGELNEALGTEYRMTGDQIENYRTMSSEIDKLIEKKRAAAYIDAYSASAGEMGKNKATVYSQYLDAYSREQDALNQFEELSKKRFGRVLSVGEFQDYMNRTYTDDKTVHNFIEDQMLAEAEKYTTASGNRRTLQEQYNEINDYFERLYDAEKAYSQENYSQVEQRLYYEKDKNDKVVTDAKSTEAELINVYNDYLKQLQASLTLARQTTARKTQTDYNNVLNNFISAAEAGSKTAGWDSGEVFSDEFKDLVQEMVDEGFDISELVGWGKDSGVFVGDVFGGNYEEIVQKQIDSGFDATKLLEWGAEAGVLSAAEYVKYFKQNAQRDLDSFFDTNAEKVNELIGPLTYEDTIKRNNSAVYGPQKLFGAGGYIPLGDEGIVAEAGPELLRVMNGGIQVTPLSRTSTNTPVGAGDKTIINNYYNTVNATVSNGYDVYELAEELAQAESYISQGKGE